MKSFDLSIALFSLIAIVLGLFYERLKRSVLNETFLSMLFGILLSPVVFNLIDVSQWGSTEDIMEKACRLTLSMSLMATALRVDPGYIRSNKRNQAVLLLLVMPAMLLSSALLIHYLLGVTWKLSFLAGAIITPTDPVLSGAIVTGYLSKKILPAKIRNTISFESGANDGLAFPFVVLCMAIFSKSEQSWTKWFVDAILFETVGAILLGIIIGYCLGNALEWCIHRKFTGKPAILPFSLSIGFSVLTGLEILGVNSILAVFVTGLMLKRTLSKREDIEDQEVQEMMSRLFTLPIFVIFGLILPWESWFNLGWMAILLVAAILLFRRLPFLFAFKPLLKGFRNADLLFIGWFGPVGVAALFYSFILTGN